MAFWTQADIDTLKAAIAGGVLIVEYDGPPKRKIQYQDLAEMRSLLAEMRGEVEAPTAYRRTTHSRGFRS